MDSADTVQVAVRVRPLLNEERDHCIKCHHQSLQIRSGPRFTFDHVFLDQPQEAVFEAAVLPLVQALQEGYNATVLAYGQTGSGKTHTIMGDQDGVLPRALEEVLDQPASENTVWQLEFLELYGEQIRDLLASNLLRPKLTIAGTDDPYVVGATRVAVQSCAEALLWLDRGLLRRVTGATAMNQTSSRSHAILTLYREETRGDQCITSKFNFVDLAGSERQKRTQARGKRLKEGIEINKGLLVLGNVISALGDGRKGFVPYRDSKLTRLLQGSLGGNHKTLMIACVSPSLDNMEESLNCLRYANRAKNIQNKAIVNMDPQSRKVAELEAQIQSLAAELIRVGDGEPTRISRQDLETILGGNITGGWVSASASTPVAGSTRPTLIVPESSDRAVELERELAKTRQLLAESRRNHDAAEETLYTVKAEKELYELQLSSTDRAAVSEAFLDKATEYERQISELRRQLEQRLSQQQQFLLDEEVSSDSIAKAKAALDRDRERLAVLQSGLNDSFYTANDGSNDIQEEEMHEQAILRNITKKYIIDDDGDVGDGPSVVDACDEPKDRPSPKKHLQADLVELSRNIAAKEDLIDQLKLSQEKYAGMRDFYEEKLQQMELVLDEKESEREKLLRELEELREGDSKTAELRDRLLEKEKHIAGLRKKQKELMDLTSVSARNSNEINKLLEEVKQMKRKKVDLQKLLNDERKSHTTEIRKLQKSAIQKEREVNKLKKISNERSIEAAKATHMAKARLDELGQLRTKYKDAEKRLRMMSVKRGVMAKAGLDPVLVGRKGNQSGTLAKSRSVDPDLVRDFFDRKVAEVAKKEALVEKMAVEWEEHFEMLGRREELSKSIDDDHDLEVQALDVRIQFKEDRIRQLTSRLGKGLSTAPGDDHDRVRDDSFLFDAEFDQLTGMLPPDLAKTIVTRVLFGMIVRERRRIAALARTASSLDEKVQEAQKSAEASKAALRSYMDEQKYEMASMSSTQQEQILALMEMVKGEGSGGSLDRGLGSPMKEASTAKLLVLANERTAALEQQIQALQPNLSEVDAYRDRIDELSASLHAETSEKLSLRQEALYLRNLLKRLRASLCRGDSNTVVLDILDQVSSSGPSRGSSPQNLLSSAFNDDLREETEQDADLEVPDWADDIMADLAIIAEGKVPPSLETVASEPASGSDKNVFDRLTDPNNFTGIQKQARSKPRGATRSRPNPKSPLRALEQRQSMSREISEKLEQIVVPEVEEPRSISPLENGDAMDNQKDYRNVFERLVSPSQFTGTQKERHNAGGHNPGKPSTNHLADDSAGRLLDALLQSDSEHFDDSGRGSTTKAFDYADQDVFERLQQTGTLAYNIKHNGTMFPEQYDTRGSQRHEASEEVVVETQGDPPLPERSTSSDYTSQDVFERLQRTTTKAYSKKTKPQTR